MPSGTTFSSAVKGIECPLALPLAQLTSTCTIVLNAPRAHFGLKNFAQHVQSATERSYCFSPELLRPFLVGELADSNDQLWKAPGTAMVVVWRTTGLQMMAAILLNPRC